jgi:hypothetical protein
MALENDAMNFSIDLAGLAALLVAGIALAKAFLTTPKENSKLDADAAKVYMEAAKGAAERAMLSEQHVADRDIKIDVLECRVGVLERALSARDAYIADLLVGIGRLMYQLQSHQYEPVWRPEPIKPVEVAK